MWVGEN
jgi:hypothetical protein